MVGMYAIHESLDTSALACLQLQLLYVPHTSKRATHTSNSLQNVIQRSVTSVIFFVPARATTYPRVNMSHHQTIKNHLVFHVRQAVGRPLDCLHPAPHVHPPGAVHQWRNICQVMAHHQQCCLFFQLLQQCNHLPAGIKPAVWHLSSSSSSAKTMELCPLVQPRQKKGTCFLAC